MKIQLFILSILAAGSLTAQTVPEPAVIPEVFAQKISPNGIYVSGQDFAYNCNVYSRITNEAYIYAGYYPGNGNSISNTGVAVGQSMETGRGVIMKEGKATTPAKLAVLAESSLDAITSDGTRACGWATNTKSGPMQIPFYCEVNEDGSISDPVVLPFPERDFFGTTPQFCTASWISDDGRTIAGILLDGTGFFSYPIIYTQNEGGQWSCSFPSQPMFNPDNLPLPKFPELDEVVVPEEPVITDFMDEQKKLEWEQAMQAYLDSGNEELNPWNNVTYYTGEQEYQNYLNDLAASNKDIMEIYYDMIDQYWRDMAIIGKGARFAPNIALSPDGKSLGAVLTVDAEEAASDFTAQYIPYYFNLENAYYEQLPESYPDLVPNQILDNGIIIAFVAPGDIDAYNSFVKLPDEPEFISFEEYMQRSNPQYVNWMQENLNPYRIGVNSGIVSFSADESVIVCGINVNVMESYIFSGLASGVESLEVSDSLESLTIYNLNGIKVGVFKDTFELRSLPKGMYIINGRKFKL